MENITKDPLNHAHFHIHDGLVLYKERLWVPDTLCIQELILHEYHASPIGGHTGIERTLARVSDSFYWKGMRSMVKDYVNHCSVCQQAKATNPSHGMGRHINGFHNTTPILPRENSNFGSSGQVEQVCSFHFPRNWIYC